MGWRGLCGQILGFDGLILGLDVMGFGGCFGGLGWDSLGLRVEGLCFGAWRVVLGHGELCVGIAGGGLWIGWTYFGIWPG